MHLHTTTKQSCRSIVNIDICLSQQSLFVFKFIFPYTFGQNVFPLWSILLTGYLHLFYPVRHLLSAYMVKFLLIHTFEFLDVLLMLLMFMFHISLLLVSTQKCVFLGYLLGQKAYKLYDLETHQIFTSCDVAFYEDIFPYESIDTSFTTIDPIIHNVVLDNPPSTALSYTPPPLTENTIVPPTNSPFMGPLCHSQRSHGPPAALRYYICNQVVSPDPLSSSSSFPNKGTRHPLYNFISYNHYTL